MPSPEPAEKLSERLDRVRSAIHALPGVLAASVGGPKAGSPGIVVIQIFVRTPADVEPARSEAVRLLGTSQIDVFVSGDMKRYE